MLVYKDVFSGKIADVTSFVPDVKKNTKLLWFLSGDELFSDSYPIKLVDDLYYEVEGKTISMSNDIDEALIGGNKATGDGEGAEEDETVESSSTTGINIVITHKLVETGFDKAAFKDWLKTYMKKLVPIFSLLKSSIDRNDED